MCKKEISVNEIRSIRIGSTENVEAATGCMDGRKMIMSTLCYIEQNEKYLMLLRNKKQKDVNKGKWIGVGGKLEPQETPEECVCREVKEETGLTVNRFRMRGILFFYSEGWEEECIFVFTSDRFSGELKECDEGELRWIDKDRIPELNLWEGDRLFLKNLLEDGPFFSMKLAYKGDSLVAHQEYFYSL